jgi:CheY-like chemotaxis protein
MRESATSITLLMADDDEEDRLLARDALRESRVINALRFVEDGEALMDYLRHTGKYAEPESAPRPALILLDLNMPRKDGREALAEIKSDPLLKSIPVVILTTSKREEDIVRSYLAGANSFIVKPVTFEGLIAVMRSVGNYWLDIVDLPKPHAIA